MGEVIDLDEYRRKAALRKARRKDATAGRRPPHRPTDARGPRHERDSNDRGPEKTPKK